MKKQVALYKMPESFDVVKILDDSVLDAYNDSIKSFNETARQTLGKFSKDNRDLTGSNPFMPVHLANSGLLPVGARLAGRKELETAISFDNSFLSGHYADFGVALRSAGDSYSPNDLLAKILAEQLEQRGIKLGGGRLIPLTALKLRENKDSAYGLVLDLNDKATKEDIQDLSQFKWDFTRDEGLACASLYRGRSWSSYCEPLALSNCDGRVVVVSGEATSQKFLDEYLIKLQRKRNEEIAKIQRRYAKAEAILRGA